MLMPIKNRWYDIIYYKRWNNIINLYAPTKSTAPISITLCCIENNWYINITVKPNRKLLIAVCFIRACSKLTFVEQYVIRACRASLMFISLWWKWLSIYTQAFSSRDYYYTVNYSSGKLNLAKSSWYSICLFSNIPDVILFLFLTNFLYPV